MNFKDDLLERVTIIEQIICRYLPKEEGYQKTVLEAMNYSIQAGGKRIRPMLMLETFKLFGGCDKSVEPFMAAVEMIHTYSLVHDDLPSMDNDEYRRGRKTTHAIYGEGMAVLAGDGLLNYAFETAINAFSITTSLEHVANALKVMAVKAGVYGMIGGQTADVEGENQNTEITLEQIIFIHTNKTAALIQEAMMIGAILAGASPLEIATVEKIGLNIGLAFQIQDDILDITGSFEILGKPIGSDLKNKKATYVSFIGMEQSVKDVEKLTKEAVVLLHSLPGKNEFLEALMIDLINRKK